MNVLPKTPQNRRLAMAVKKNDVEGVGQALDEGADPNTYWDSGYRFVASLAARLAAEPTEQGQAAGAILALLAKAGLDPLHERVVGAADSEPRTVGHDPLVRHHPTVAPIMQARAREAWLDQASPSPPALMRWARELDSDHPVDQALREMLLQRQDMVDARQWWEASLRCRTSLALVKFARQHFPSHMTVDRALDFLARENQLQNGQALAWWAGQLDAKSRADFYLGRAGNSGALAISARRVSFVKENLWQAALDDEGVMEAMAKRGLFAAHLAVAMLHAEPNQALALLDMAKAHGVDLEAVRLKHARSAWPKLYDGQWAGDKWPGTDQDDLLGCHLAPKRNLSVALMRRLVQEGLEPNPESLRRLCSAMTYSTPERQLSKVFFDWVGKGVDPQPEGHAPAWSLAGRGVASRLEARFRGLRLEGTLEPADAAPVRHRGTRL